LSIAPDKDQALHQAAPRDAHVRACERCGHTVSTDPHLRTCPSCGNETWAHAVQPEQNRKQGQERPQPVLS
jgi:rubrerythrin